MKRRAFLKRYAATAAAGIGAYSTLGGLSLTNALAQSSDYRALVCVFLFGGNDSFNMVCLLYTSPSPRDQRGSRMPSSA